MHSLVTSYTEETVHSCYVEVYSFKVKHKIYKTLLCKKKIVLHLYLTFLLVFVQMFLNAYNIVIYYFYRPSGNSSSIEGQSVWVQCHFL